jgi:CheY-like chemotaxis protein
MRVLLVEDEANARDVYSRLLECDGHHVVAVGAATPAMAAIDAGIFDAALIDIALGDVDGYAVLDYLKRRQPGVRAVLMTAYDVPDAARRQRAAAADAFLAKPLRWSDARAAIAPASREHPHR